MSETWEEWTPPNAVHVVMRFTKRHWDEELKRYDEQRIEITCKACGQVWKGGCLSGRPRAHAMRFAAQHLHRDPLGAS